jgi:hypothetical protein
VGYPIFPQTASNSFRSSSTPEVFCASKCSKGQTTTEGLGDMLRDRHEIQPPLAPSGGSAGMRLPKLHNLTVAETFSPLQFFPRNKTALPAVGQPGVLSISDKRLRGEGQRS